MRSDKIKAQFQCRKDTNAVSGMRVTNVPKNQTTMPPHFPSHPFHEVEVCRGREVSEAKSNHGSILRQMCRFFLKGTGTRSPCEYWDPPECQFYRTETGCKAGVQCLFPHHKVDEQPNKKPKKGYYSHERRKRRQECCGYCENCTTIGLRLARLGSIGFSKRKTAPEKLDAKSLGIDSKSTIHSV